jgi:hypothetical protein
MAKYFIRLNFFPRLLGYIFIKCSNIENKKMVVLVLVYVRKR